MHKSRRTELRATQAVGLAVLLAAFRAGADTHYVDLNSTNPVPPFTSWSTAATNIQDAVDAADSGDTVRIAAAEYFQQVVLAFKNNLTLVGEPGVEIHAFPGMVETLKSYGWFWYPLVAIYRSSGVVLSGLTVDGGQLADLYTYNPPRSLPSRLLGIYFLGAGGEVTNCTVRGFRASTLEVSTDVNALHVLNRVDTGSAAVNVRVVDSTFMDNQFSIVLRGDPISAANAQLLRVTAAIERNVITGLGPAPIECFGIWIVDGVATEVSGNTIGQHSGTRLMQSSGIAAYDAAAQTHGRFIPLQKLTIEGNTFMTNGQHLMIVGANDGRVVNNKFVGTAPNPEGRWQGVMLNGTNIVAADNNFSALPVGMVLGGSFGTNWPALEPTVNPRLNDNWFCDVTEPIRIVPPVFGLEEQGTETNCPVAPRFRSFTKSSAGEARALLRGWHGDTVMLQASTNLVDWVPVHTHIMELPTHECRDMNADGAPQRFYRARRL